MNKEILLILISLLAFNLFSQNNIDLNSLPDVSEYIHVQSNPDADTIIVALHGGPSEDFTAGDFKPYEVTSTISIVEIEQSHHRNSLIRKSDLTDAEAIACHDTTAAMLQKVILHYSDQGKVVVPMGHSFGAFMLTEYLDDYGTEDIYRIIIMAGRLNMNQEVVDTLRSGYFAWFLSEGLVPIYSGTPSIPPSQPGLYTLMAGAGYNRYVDSLENEDLSKLMYLYGEHDGAVGRLLEEEVDMLVSTNAMEVKIPQGGHTSMFEEEYVNRVFDFIRSDQIPAGIVSLISEAEVNIYPTVVESTLTVDAQKKGKLLILNMQGQLVASENCLADIQTISLNNLNSGQYLAVYQTFDNEVKTGRLIVN